MKFEYYFYNRETDKYLYHYDFQHLFKVFNGTQSHEKSIGVTVIDEDGCTLMDDVILEYKE